jgi:hypothetical protein
VSHTRWQRKVASGLRSEGRSHHDPYRCIATCVLAADDQETEAMFPSKSLS